jgi:hypothetical protein
LSSLVSSFRTHLVVLVVTPSSSCSSKTSYTVPNDPELMDFITVYFNF